MLALRIVYDMREEQNWDVKEHGDDEEDTNDDEESDWSAMRLTWWEGLQLYHQKLHWWYFNSRVPLLTHVIFSGL